ncbi:MAG TPA: hypothetical protein VJM74_03790 [Nitrososphaeraceae archaeon]|nr:hypothetical protein [Nitrososphaeraceae archaeon]
MPKENIVGPTVTWDEIKDEKVKSNDGNKIGKIKEISKYHLRIQKGSVKKKSFWIPKSQADTYDGKYLWLIADEDEIHQKYLYGEEPPGGKSTKNIEGIGVVDKRMTGISSKPSGKSRYKNIRDPD